MTNLQRWLRLRGEGCRTLARQLGISKEAIYRLARPGQWSRQNGAVPFEVFRQVADFTGIRPGVLLEDAIEWREGQDADSSARPSSRASL